ncbi:MAG: cytochrome c-type biogenesis protein CcmH, partial [Parvibaculaceae bacterium]
ARDLRILIRDRLKAGDSDDQVLAFLVDRYGEFVLLKPRLHPSTLLLWFGPFLVLGLGILAVLRLRRAPAGSAEAALDEKERQRLSEIVKDT